MPTNASNSGESRLEIPSGNFAVVSFGINQAEVYPPVGEVFDLGAVVVDREFHKLGEFGALVRPLRQARPSGSESSRTAVSEEDLSAARSFPEVAEDLRRWLKELTVEWWSSWSPIELTQLTRELKVHSIPSPLAYPHHSLRRHFRRNQHVREELEPAEALRLVGLESRSGEHRALDQARDLVRVLPWIAGDFSLDGITPKEKTKLKIPLFGRSKKND